MDCGSIRDGSGVLLVVRTAGTVSGFNASREMRTRDNGKAILRRAFKHLEREVPGRVAWIIRNLRHPQARWVRVPAGVLLVFGGVFSILPFLGIWMLPLGLLLVARDVPFLRVPVGRFTIWGTQKWAAIRQRVFQRSLER
jgi:hypothetical protein